MHFRVKVQESTCLRQTLLWDNRGSRGKHPRKSFFVSLDTLIHTLLYLEIDV